MGWLDDLFGRDVSDEEMQVDWERVQKTADERQAANEAKYGVDKDADKGGSKN